MSLFGYHGLLLTLLYTLVYSLDSYQSLTDNKIKSVPCVDERKDILMPRWPNIESGNIPMDSKTFARVSWFLNTLDDVLHKETKKRTDDSTILKNMFLGVRG